MWPRGAGSAVLTSGDWKLWSPDKKDEVLQLAFLKSLGRPELDAQLTGLLSVDTEDMLVESDKSTSIQNESTGVLCSK